MAGAFNIISFAEAQAVDVVHVDSIAATVWIESESESTMYGSFFDRTARLSLAPRDSLSLIELEEVETSGQFMPSLMLPQGMDGLHGVVGRPLIRTAFAA